MIKIKNLKYSVNSNRENLTILDIESLEVTKGEKIAFFGESGCGKSTLLNIIAGFIKASSGIVEIDGENICDLTETEMDHLRASKIDYIFQDFNLLQGYTALENIFVAMKLSGNKPDKKQVLNLLNEVGLKGREHHLPSQLSFGQKQRVAIARAISKKSKIILADEPTGSLDPARKIEMMNLLIKTADTHNCTLVVVTHETSSLKNFEHTIDFTGINKALHMEVQI